MRDTSTFHGSSAGKGRLPPRLARAPRPGASPCATAVTRTATWATLRSMPKVYAASTGAPTSAAASPGHPHRQLDGEGAAEADLAGEADAAAHRLDEAAGDPQPEAEAAGAPPRHRALEAAEEAAVVRGGDADAAVLDRHRRPRVALAHRDLDGLAAAVLHRVGHQVGQDLVDAQPV